MAYSEFWLDVDQAVFYYRNWNAHLTIMASSKELVLEELGKEFKETDLGEIHCRGSSHALRLCQSCGWASFGLFSDHLLPSYLPLALQPWVQEEHIESIPPNAWRISEN
jgi:hypothetical protein